MPDDYDEHDQHLIEVPSQEAGCTENGNIHYWECDMCQKKYSDIKAEHEVEVDSIIIPAKGHLFTEVIDKVATETKQGSKHEECSICGYKKSAVVIPMLGKKQPQKGEKVLDDKKSGKYEVLDTAKKEVAYCAPATSKEKTVIIPDVILINGESYKVTKIADGAFRGNKIVTKVQVGNTIVSIGKDAFNGASKLKKISISKSVKEIGANAFKGCTSLIRMTLPSKSIKIGANAFNKCKHLKTLKISSAKLTSKTVEKKAFKGITKVTTIKAPKRKLTEYKKLFRKKGLSSKVKVKGY